MRPFSLTSAGRATLVITSLGLIFMLVLLVWMALSTQRMPSPLADEGEVKTELKRMSALLVILFTALLLILFFVISAYAILRIGRTLSESRVGGKPTEYVDAWSRYRLSEEEIAAATAEEAHDDPEREGRGPAEEHDG